MEAFVYFRLFRLYVRYEIVFYAKKEGETRRVTATPNGREIMA